MDEINKLYIRLDAHKKFCYATSMDKSPFGLWSKACICDGNIIGQNRFPTTNGCLDAFIDKNGSNAKVVRSLKRRLAEAMVEASTSRLRVYDYMDANGINVIMAHPTKVKAITSAKVKTDKIDSEVLAHLLRANLIPEAYVPPKHSSLMPPMRG